jgi:hypothetical protein
VKDENKTIPDVEKTKIDKVFECERIISAGLGITKAAPFLFLLSL